MTIMTRIYNTTHIQLELAPNKGKVNYSIFFSRLIKKQKIQITIIIYFNMYNKLYFIYILVTNLYDYDSSLAAFFALFTKVLGDKNL